MSQINLQDKTKEVFVFSPLSFRARAMSQINLAENAQEAAPLKPLSFRSKTMSQINVEDENQEESFSPGSPLASRRNTMQDITAVDDKTQDALAFTSPLFSSPGKTTADLTALSYFNILTLNCRVPCKEYKRHHKLINVWNKEVVLAMHPAILKPTVKQITLNILEDMDFDISALNARLAPLIEAERLLGFKGFCRIGKVNGLAFAAALALPAEQREEEIKLLGEKIDRMNGEYIALYAGAYASDDGKDEPDFSDDRVNAENGVELGGPSLGDDIGSVGQRLGAEFVTGEILTTAEEKSIDVKRLRPYSL